MKKLAKIVNIMKILTVKKKKKNHTLKKQMPVKLEIRKNSKSTGSDVCFQTCFF